MYAKFQSKSLNRISSQFNIHLTFKIKDYEFPKKWGGLVIHVKRYVKTSKELFVASVKCH